MKRRSIHAALALAFVLLSPSRNAESRSGGTVAGEVSVKKKGLLGGLSDKSDRSGVVIYLENVPQPASPTAAAPAAVRQRDKKFAPGMVVVPKGGRVEFPNDDKIYHNVFSLSQAGKFDLGLYKSGTSKSVVFDKPGVVDVYCNIHPEMVASIKVVDGIHYAVTDEAGRFRIDDVPPGTYPIVAWIPRGEEVRGQVTVTAGGTAHVALAVVEGSASSPHHLRKDGTPYGRYQ